MLNSANNAQNRLEGNHTGWYDYAMNAVTARCLIIACSIYVGVIALWAFCAHPAFGDDEVQLRGPQSITGNSVPAQGEAPANGKSSAGGTHTSSKAANSASTSTLTTPVDSAQGAESAKKAVEQDFHQHLNSGVAKETNNTPGTAHGASGDKGAAVLSTQTQSATTGPSTSSKDAGALDQIELKQPALTSLVTINNYLNPFQLDASSSSALNLRQALQLGLDQNLDLAISRTTTYQNKFALYSQMSNFLPNMSSGFSEYVPDGHISLPFSPTAFFGPNRPAHYWDLQP